MNLCSKDTFHECQRTKGNVRTVLTVQFCNNKIRALSQVSQPIDCLAAYLSLVKAAEYEEDVGAEALGDLSLVAEQAGQAVHQEVAGQELSNSHQLQQELK